MTAVIMCTIAEMARIRGRLVSAAHLGSMTGCPDGSVAGAMLILEEKRRVGSSGTVKAYKKSDENFFDRSQTERIAGTYYIPNSR
jgi:hypothetical protein